VQRRNQIFIDTLLINYKCYTLKVKVLNDKDLDLLRRGNNEPLVRIFNSNYSTCVSHIKRLCNCQDDDAKDLVMDAIIVLKEKILTNEFENINLQSFLISVAKNKWRNRKQKYDRIVFVDPFNSHNLIIDNEKSNEHSLGKDRELAAIKDAIQNATNKCGELLRRNLYDGIPLEMLIDELGYANYNVIKSSKSRCIKKLRIYVSNILSEE